MARYFLVNDVPEYEEVKMNERELMDTAHFISDLLNGEAFEFEEQVTAEDIESAIDILESANIFVEEII